MAGLLLGALVAWLGVVVPGALVEGSWVWVVLWLGPPLGWLAFGLLSLGQRTPGLGGYPWVVASGVGALLGAQGGQSSQLLAPAALGALVAVAGWTLGQRLGRAGWAPLALLGLGLAAPLFGSSWGSRPALPPRAQAPSVLFLGIDGLDARLIPEAMARGDLPALAALAGEGAAAPLHSLQPTSSPFLWNSLYTGVDPALHLRRPLTYALGGALVRRVSRKNLFDLAASGLARPGPRLPLAVWEVFQQAGYDVAVSGAWETNPVPEASPFFLAANAEHAPELPRGRLAEGARAEAYWFEPGPGDAYAALDRAPHELPAAFWEGLAGRSPDGLLTAAMSGPESSDASQRAARMRGVLAADHLRHAVSRRWWSECRQPCFNFTYLRSADMAQHAYAHQLRGEVDPADLVSDGFIPRVWAQVDQWVASLVAAAPPGTVVVVVSDHGLNLDEHTEAGGGYKTGWHDFAPDGLIVVRVPGQRPRLDGPVHLFDVAPTLLALAGLPMLADMEGHVLEGVAPRAGVVDTWWRLAPTLHGRGNPKLSDQSLEEQLKAIGYTEP